MENAEIISLSRQTVLRRKLDTIANNIANMNTDAYKANGIMFEEYIDREARDYQFRFTDQRLSFVQDFAVYNDFTQGAIRQTGNPFDVALAEADAWFVIERPDGSEAYTRAGGFHLDDSGQLVTAEGYSVLSEGGRIVFDSSDSDVLIASDGTVTTNNGQRGKLRIVQFENMDELKRIGHDIYEGDNPIAHPSPRVSQGAIESSNVSAVQQVSDLVLVTRAYENVAKYIKDIDELRGRAIERLGSVQ